MVLLYAVTGFVVLQLSFGLNGTLYRTLLGHVSSLQGFRALARFGVFVGCALAVLAGLGTQALEMTWPSLRARRRLLTTAIVGLLVLEYSNRALPLSQAVTAAVPDAYKVLQRAAPGAIVEFPIPDPRALPGYDPYYEAWSVWHWRPMLNGYSGFYAPAYLQALPTLADFPDDDAVALLRERQVRFVIIHRSFYKQSEYTSLALRIAQQPALALWGVYKDPYGQADIVEIRQ
jgi:hypothetical protein